MRGLVLAGVVLGALALWEGLKAVWGIPDYKLPHTYAILGELFRRTGRGELWLVALGRNALTTGGEALAGFLLGGIAGFAIAVAFIHWPLAEQGLLPYVVASQTVPILAIAPMIVVWLGTGWTSKAIIASYLTFFPVMMAPTTLAVAEILSAVKRYGTDVGRRSLTRIWATASVVGAIIGELPVGSASGLGVVIINAAQYYTFRPTNLWAAILVAALLGIAFYALVAGAERVLVRGRRPAAVPEAE